MHCWNKADYELSIIIQLCIVSMEWSNKFEISQTFSTHLLQIVGPLGLFHWAIHGKCQMQNKYLPPFIWYCENKHNDVIEINFLCDMRVSDLTYDFITIQQRIQLFDHTAMVKVITKILISHHLILWVLWALLCPNLKSLVCLLLTSCFCYYSYCI